jgi:transitional endoplasmic reticulum ATPase
MNEEPQEIQSLRDALTLSPDNHVIRKLLADTLSRFGLFESAIDEYRACLRNNPEDEDLLLALAQAYHQFDRHNEALVIIEKLLQVDSPDARALHLHAKLMEGAGSTDIAAQSFSRAKHADPALSDPELEAVLQDSLRQSPELNDELTESLPVDDLPPDILFEVERPNINFDQVGGMEDLKKQIRMKIILPLENPEIYEAYDAKAGGGILMYGPPGCGKTLLARATAGQVKARFMAIGIHEVLDMWIGQSERNLHEIFEQARACRPCVLFFDEVDALAASRTDMRQSAGRQLINQFLDELDGVKASNEGLLVLAATNAPWHLDPAFRRPGRFDRIIFVPPPDEAARIAVLQILLKGKPTGDIDWETLGRRAKNFSGADLKSLVDTAIEALLENAAETGEIKPITTKVLASAMKGTKPSTKEWFSTAKNYALYSNQGGHFDDILDYLNLR